jgi:hypothetical protein
MLLVNPKPWKKVSINPRLPILVCYFLLAWAAAFAAF